MKNDHAIRWLYEELPGWVAEGVVSPAAAEALKRRYGMPEPRGGKPWALFFFGVVGALLIGAGIILLLAHNWEDLTRPWRTVVSFLPLLAGQGLSLYVLLRSRGVVWREASAGFHALGVGASIALVAQTYHMPGSFDTFMLTWMLLILPLVYLLQATVPLLFYFAGITSWAGYQTGMEGPAFGWWLLMAATIPYGISVMRAGVTSPRSAVVQWGAILAFTCSLGMVLERVFPGLWILAYAFWFTGLYLAGGFVDRESRSRWLFPARTFGGSALLVFAFLLSWVWPWESIGWDATRWVQSPHPWVAGLDVVIVSGLAIAVVAFWVGTVRRGRKEDLGLGGFAPLVVVAYGVAASGGDVVAAVMMSCFVAFVGLARIVNGVRRVELREFNSGMGIFTALLVFRFFDSDFSFITKGLVFIGLGAVFLICNVVLTRRKGKEGA
ncbi:MAG TPA: DUF2157 domain-containing protein [Kiritimatiellia bacterium]|mgnify:CR=1 FL=1|nr:DUF2157 domain-containing protein [Kiritimatiellia bacterium]